MTTQRTLRIQNMSCGNCVRHVSRALADIPNLTVKDVQVGSATVEFDPGQLPEAHLIAALAEAGYPAAVQH